jgi:hypothetical protein
MLQQRIEVHATGGVLWIDGEHRAQCSLGAAARSRPSCTSAWLRLIHTEADRG